MKQDDGQLASFVLQYFRNKARYKKFNNGYFISTVVLLSTGDFQIE